MLLDQIFQPHPLIGLGPEFFYSAQLPRVLNIGLITKLRALQRDGSSFGLIYFGVSGGTFPGPSDAVAQIERFGVALGEIVIFNAASSGGYCHGMIRMCDFVYSPEFSTKITVPNQRKLVGSPEKVLGLLYEAFLSPRPYDPEQLRTQFDAGA